MAERFLNTNEFTLDELINMCSSYKHIINKCSSICDYYHVMSQVVCVGEGLADVILSCI